MLPSMRMPVAFAFDHAPENFALLRRMALNLLNREQTFKRSNRMKRYRATMDNDYLLQILAASKSELITKTEAKKGAS